MFFIIYYILLFIDLCVPFICIISERQVNLMCNAVIIILQFPHLWRVFYVYCKSFQVLRHISLVL